MENKKVIVRADRAGVFFGNIKERIGSEVTMTNVRRLWFWSGAASLSQLAINGVTNRHDCKFTIVVPYIEGWVIPYIHEKGAIFSEEYEENGIVVSGKIPEEFFHRINGFVRS